jgi:c-di-GMP-related signal transduction protein
MAENRFFLGRQPILNLQHDIFGYELLFRAADVPIAEVADVSLASASVIVDAVAGFGLGEVLGPHQGFVNVNDDLLMSDMLELLPKDRVILELLETLEPRGPVIERCRDLKAKGFRLALDDHSYSPPFEPLYEWIDIIKIDLLQQTLSSLQDEVARFRHLPVTLLAEKVETHELFSHCRSLGFTLFQGYFFARPVVLTKKRIDISGSTLFRLLQQLLNDADIRDIEETFKLCPNLVYNLLRLVNSVSLGLPEPIHSLRHAIAMLGRRQLIRWTQLAMFAGSDTRAGGGFLLELSATRGRLMELVGRRHCAQSRDQDFPETAFMTGILSLVDVLFEVPMAQVVRHLSLAEDVRAALLDREGELGQLLHLAELVEQADFPAVSSLLGTFGISHEQLLISQLEAINWTHGLLEQI